MIVTANNTDYSRYAAYPKRTALSLSASLGNAMDAGSEAGTEKITPEQTSYFRAGHAHAGVLVTLSIIGQLVLDQSRLGEELVWAIRIALFVAPLLISGGFFGGAPRTAGGPAGPLIRFIPIGAVVFGLGTLGVGIGLLIPE